MEDDSLKNLRDTIANAHEFLSREYGEEIERYAKAGKFGRWLIKRRYPEAVEHYEYTQAQESVREAIRSAASDPHNDVPLHTAA